MPNPENFFTPAHREQFYSADLHGKLTFFETRLAAHRLDAAAATEMLAAIHSELETPRRQDHTVYARYASLMETLRQASPDVYQAVVNSWKRQQEAEAAAEIVRSTTAIPEETREEVDADEGTQETARNVSNASELMGDTRDEATARGAEAKEGQEAEEDEAEEEAEAEGKEGERTETEETEAAEAEEAEETQGAEAREGEAVSAETTAEVESGTAGGAAEETAGASVAEDGAASALEADSAEVEAGSAEEETSADESRLESMEGEAEEAAEGEAAAVKNKL